MSRKNSGIAAVLAVLFLTSCAYGKSREPQVSVETSTSFLNYSEVETTLPQTETEAESSIKTTYTSSQSQEPEEPFAEVTDVFSAEEKMLSEKEAAKLLYLKGFDHNPPTYSNEESETAFDGDLDIESRIEIDKFSEEKHPCYKSLYRTDDGTAWEIVLMGDTITACYYMDNSGCVPEKGTPSLIVSESKQILSYLSGNYYLTLPNPSECQVYVVKELNAAALNEASNKGEEQMRKFAETTAKTESTTKKGKADSSAEGLNENR